MPSSRWLSFPQRSLRCASLALAICCLALCVSAAPATNGSRNVWVFSDPHTGFNAITNADKTLTQWLDLAVADMNQSKLPLAFVLGLGDLSNDSLDEQYVDYLAIRKKSVCPTWWEIAGNHDYTGIKEKRWAKYIGTPTRFTLSDGNGIWICFSVERGGAGGRISEATLRWLRETIAANQKRNIIVCSHQPVGNTVAKSNKDHRLLYSPASGDPEPETIPNKDPKKPGEKREATDVAIERVAQLVKDLRVDLWLSGHIHGGNRTKDYIVHKGNTTFINVASVNTLYGNNPPGSFVLEFKAGSKTVAARFRNDQTGKFMDEFSTTVEFPNPWEFSGVPVMTP